MGRPSSTYYFGRKRDHKLIAPAVLERFFNMSQQNSLLETLASKRRNRYVQALAHVVELLDCAREVNAKCWRACFQVNIRKLPEFWDLGTMLRACNIECAFPLGS